MNENSFAVVEGEFKKVSDLPMDDSIFYRCQKCGDVLPSLPADSIGWSCGNIAIDTDLWRIFILAFTEVSVLKKI
jgi:hypothetical protein